MLRQIGRCERVEDFLIRRDVVRHARRYSSERMIPTEMWLVRVHVILRGAVREHRCHLRMGGKDVQGLKKALHAYFPVAVDDAVQMYRLILAPEIPRSLREFTAPLRV